ncbi:phosphonate C-P lyase system protein PhnG [Synechococcus sp. PCC 6716]|nr:phosphonate C-P lyase system protein PhnG [Synechococcus sp. PCC 6716]
MVQVHGFNRNGNSNGNGNGNGYHPADGQPHAQNDSNGFIPADLPPREQWVRALTAHPPQTLIDLADTLGRPWHITHDTLPETGLTLLQLVDSVFHHPYYLGELPLSIASVVMSGADGEHWSGAAQVMSDVPNLATALAVCDAILAHRLEGWPQVAELVQQGMAQRQRDLAQRGAMLARTRVNFSLLSQEDSDDIC